MIMIVLIFIMNNLLLRIQIASQDLQLSSTFQLYIISRSQNQIGNMPFNKMFEGKYQILQKIGKPKYPHIGTNIVRQQHSNAYFIMKQYNIEQLEKAQNKQKQSHFLDSIFYHPNLLTIERVEIEKDNMYIIEEYCQQGDLGYHINRFIKKRKGAYPQLLISKWLLQLLLALECLHFNKVCHSSIKSSNIYLTSLGNLKLDESYFVNNWFLKHKKQKGSVLMEGYEPMVQEKRFKKSERRDIYDFGLLINDLCNLGKKPKTSKIQDKKEGKAKVSDRLPEMYSKQLNEIYLQCLKVKKTKTIVKDLLRRSYFLQTMRQFIVDKQMNMSVFDRIPIKKYFIHQKIKESSTTDNVKNKQNTKKHQHHSSKNKLPKIEQKNNNQVKLSPLNTGNRPKRISQNLISNKQSEVKRSSKVKPTAEKLKELEKVEKVRKYSQQVRKLSQQKKKRQSNVNVKSPPVTPQENKVKEKQHMLPPPNLPKQKKQINQAQRVPSFQQVQHHNETRNSRKKSSENKRKHISHSQSKSPTKKISSNRQFALTPEITFGGKKMDRQSLMQLQKAKSQIYQQERQEQKSQVQETLSKVSQNLAKIFSDLKIREDDDQQLSFQMDQTEQSQFRLTLNDLEQQQVNDDLLMKTYKNKFNQIVGELKGRYQPNLETIIQKTNQWDSNDIFLNQELLKRLKLEESQVIQSFQQEEQTIQNQFKQQKQQNRSSESERQDSKQDIP